MRVFKVLPTLPALPSLPPKLSLKTLPSPGVQTLTAEQGLQLASLAVLLLLGSAFPP